MAESLTKVQLLAKIKAAHTRLEQTLSHLSPVQLTTPDPVNGWTVKDHLAHLAVWQNGIVALLQHRPRWAAMQVDEATVKQTDMDGLNNLLIEQAKTRPLAEVMTAFQQAHEQMLTVLTLLSDEDLAKSYAHYAQSEPDEWSSRPVMGWIVGNTFDHYEEHQSWIEAFLEQR